MRATVAGDTSVGGGHAGGGRVHLGIVVAHDAHVVPGVLDLLRLDAHVEVLHVQIVEADRGVRLSLYPQTHSSGPGITVVKWGPPQSQRPVGGQAEPGYTPAGACMANQSTHSVVCLYIASAFEVIQGRFLSKLRRSSVFGVVHSVSP